MLYKNENGDLYFFIAFLMHNMITNGIKFENFLTLLLFK